MRSGLLKEVVSGFDSGSVFGLLSQLAKHLAMLMVMHLMQPVFIASRPKQWIKNVLVLAAPLAAASSLKKELVADLDILIIRELTGGIYFGEPRGVEVRDNERVGFNTLVYSEHEIERIARVGFELATKRNGKLCSVDKANVLEVSQLWREKVSALAPEYPDVELSHMYVDNAAMQLVRAPKQFDVMVTAICLATFCLMWRLCLPVAWACCHRRP